MKRKSLFEHLCERKTLLNAWDVVKDKGAGGGVDGETVLSFEDGIEASIDRLANELRDRSWVPEPYLRISIPKGNGENRNLGLLCVRDKIVQQAIKQMIEPGIEKIFVSNSYGYRPGKGPVKAIRFALSCLSGMGVNYVLRLDLDDYFDNIDQDILFRKLSPFVDDDEILRLVKLCVGMGAVDKSKRWEERGRGVPQGAVLSPLLANLYLHSFDAFVLSLTRCYVRYADDFLIGCRSTDEAERIRVLCSDFLENRLGLRLNSPCITPIKDGVEFLGIVIGKSCLSISDNRQKELDLRIRTVDWAKRGLSEEGIRTLSGIHGYYGSLLPEEYLSRLDDMLISRLRNIISERRNDIPGKTVLAEALKGVQFFSEVNKFNRKLIISELVNAYAINRSEGSGEKDNVVNRKGIAQRKRQYRQLEARSSELIVNTFGTSIGICGKGIRLKTSGRKMTVVPVPNLRHITILCDGVSLSSNVIRYCMDNRIGIDFFTGKGQHYASVLSDKYLQTSLWKKQVSMGEELRHELATKIILAKLKNQFNLIKYFHKYHKDTSDVLVEKFEEISPVLTETIASVKNLGKEDFITKLSACEARGAEQYWSYVRTLINDDGVEFEKRIRRGAKDLVNSLLNYGYAIIYARIWRMLLSRKMNPCESVIHVRHRGKPTLVYDIIEMFRTQAVDRVVISMLQRHEPLSVSNGMIDKESKGLLVKNIAERLNRYEKYRGKETRLVDIIDKQIKEISDFIGEGITYRPYIAKW